MKKQRLLIIFVTAPTKDSALSLAKALLDTQLVACVNILPEITSVYNWKGAREESSEVLLLIKSREELFPELEKLIRTNHPYEVPEIVAVDVAAVSEPYAEWVCAETTKK